MTHQEYLSIPEISKFLESEGTEFLSSEAEWSGATSAIVHQDEAQFKTPKLGFHLVELCLKGRASGFNSFDGILGSAETEYRPNGLFYVPHGRSVHAALNIVDMDLLQIYIEDRVFQDVASELCTGDASSLDFHGFNAHYDPRLSAIMHNIRAEMEGHADSSALMVDYAVQQLAILLMRHSQDVQGRLKKQLRTTLTDADFARAVDIIEANLDRNIGLKTIARELGISVFNFSRSFKSSAGIPPHQYLMQRRVTQVQDKLKNSKDSLADIAYACGFSSQAHMTTAFRKLIGTSPAKYRKDVAFH